MSHSLYLDDSQTKSVLSKGDITFCVWSDIMATQYNVAVKSIIQVVVYSHITGLVGHVISLL